MPLVAVVFGYFGFRGTLVMRLLLLNAAMVAALISEMVRALIRDPAAAMAVSTFPLVLVALCAGITIVFLLIYFVHRVIDKYSNARTN